MTNLFLRINFAAPSGGNTGSNHFGTIGIVIVVAVAVLIAGAWFFMRGRQ